MTVKGFLRKWYGKEIADWGGTTSEEYREFEADYRRAIKDCCKDIGMEIHGFNKNHYCFSCVLKSERTGQFYYMSIPDVRHRDVEWATHVLYRTMKHEKDWTGGPNRYSDLEDLAGNLAKLDARAFSDVQKKINEATMRSAEINDAGGAREVAPLVKD